MGKLIAGTFSIKVDSEHKLDRASLALALTQRERLALQAKMDARIEAVKAEFMPQIERLARKEQTWLDRITAFARSTWNKETGFVQKFKFLTVKWSNPLGRTVVADEAAAIDFIERTASADMKERLIRTKKSLKLDEVRAIFEGKEDQMTLLGVTIVTDDNTPTVKLNSEVVKEASLINRMMKVAQ